MRAASVLACMIALVACSGDAHDGSDQPGFADSAMGNDPIPVVPSPGPSTIVAARRCPTQLVVDGAGLTWLETGTSPAVVMRAPKAGGAAAALMSIADPIAIKQLGDF